MEKLLTELVERLTKAHGEGLVSAVLYGSGASGERHKDFSDLNVLCVLQQVTPKELREGEPVFRWWQDKKNPSPLLLSEHEFQTSTDCFPIEFLDIKQQHRLLHGRDVVKDLVVDRTYHRVQVEHELRAKMLRLRQKAASAINDREMLGSLLVDSLSTFSVLFRHALFLKGLTVAHKKREILSRSAEEFGLQTDSFLKLLDVREGTAKLKDIDPPALLTPYLNEISRVIHAVDGMQP